MKKQQNHNKAMGFKIFRNIDFKRQVKASALGYALAFLLLVALVCSGLIFIGSVYKRLELNYSMQEHLIFDNAFALKYGMLNDAFGETKIAHLAGDTSLISVKPWGGFYAVHAKTFHKKKVLERMALFGKRTMKSLPALYYPEHSRPLKLAGNAFLEGTVYGPSSGFEDAFISEKFYQRDKYVFGSYQISSKDLPPLCKELENLSFEFLMRGSKRIERLPKDSSFMFNHQTTLYSQMSSITINQSLVGNLIIHSFDSIVVTQDAHLENVILIAPKITIESGFRGSGQFIAEQRIRCNQNVKLSYPSVLILLSSKMEHLTYSRREIHVDENSVILGGILLTRLNRHESFPYLRVAQKSTVAGLVYNSGDTELYGNLIGHFFTQTSVVDFKGYHGQHIFLDCKISSRQLPESFVLPTWLKEQGNGSPVMITKF